MMETRGQAPFANTHQQITPVGCGKWEEKVKIRRCAPTHSLVSLYNLHDFEI